MGVLWEGIEERGIEVDEGDQWGRRNGGIYKGKNDWYFL